LSTTFVSLREVELPDFGLPVEEPELQPSLYEERLHRIMSSVRDAGLEGLIVYADREHFANVAYLTGFEPRFEEALLVLIPGHEPTLVVGPENLNYSRIAKVSLQRVLYPPFGLLGQNRRNSPALGNLLAKLDLTSAMKIGLAGWKYFGPFESSDFRHWLDTPSFIADAIRGVVGNSGDVVNANDLLMNSSKGLRAVNEIDQLASFEFAACYASEAVKRVIFGLRPGEREYEAASRMQLIGMPQSCHPMLASGDRAGFGLTSPSSRRMQRGKPFLTCVGLWGALTARAGWLVAGADELPSNVADYVEKLAGPYFACIADWYETIGIGVSGGTIDALVKKHLGDPFFGVSLNPGHLIHLDEWLDSPVYPDSSEVFVSGNAIQVDIIPATGTPYFTSGVEDGIALLDKDGRAAFAAKYADAWTRIESRRAFMADVLGIQLRDEVLPFSNIPAYLPPFLLSPHQAFSIKR
jgi:hypothetical protein